jgi:hypothetical protein
LDLVDVVDDLGLDLVEVVAVTYQGIPQVEHDGAQFGIDNGIEEPLRFRDDLLRLFDQVDDIIALALVLIQLLQLDHVVVLVLVRVVDVLVQLHHLARSGGVDLLQRSLDVTQKLGIAVYAVILQILVERLDIVIDEAGGYFTDLQKLFDKGYYAVVEANDVVVLVNDLIHHQLFQLLLRHILAGQDLRFIDRILIAEKHLNNIFILVKKIDKIFYA